MLEGTEKCASAYFAFAFAFCLLTVPDATAGDPPAARADVRSRSLIKAMR